MTGPACDPDAEPADGFDVFTADHFLDGATDDAVTGVRRELRSILDVLRQPAAPGELAREPEVVAAMAGVLSAPEAPAPCRPANEAESKMWRKLLTIKAIGAAAGIVLLGGSAAAAVGYPPPLLRDAFGASAQETELEPVTDTTVTTSTASTDDPADDVGAAPEQTADTDAPDDAPTTTAGDPVSTDAPDTPAETPTPTSVVCQDGNHGATVSSAARDHSGTAAEHRDAVVTAAHSDCGKPNGAGGGADEEPDGTDAAVEPGSPVDAGPTAAEPSGQGNGKGGKPDGAGADSPGRSGSGGGRAAGHGNGSPGGAPGGRGKG